MFFFFLFSFSECCCQFCSYPNIRWFLLQLSVAYSKPSKFEKASLCQGSVKKAEHLFSLLSRFVIRTL